MMVFPDSPSALGLDECLLCLESSSCSAAKSRNPTPLESVWTESCAESVCKLLDVAVETFKPFFLSGQYCPSCQQMIRDVDYLIRSVESFQLQLSECRIKVSTLLHDNIEVWLDKTNVVNPSTPLSQNGSAQMPYGQFPIRSHFHPLEMKREAESPLNSQDYEYADPLSFSVSTPENDVCRDDMEEDVPQSGVRKSSPKSACGSRSRSDRGKRGSNRLRKEISYREDSDSGESQPPLVNCPMNDLFIPSVPYVNEVVTPVTTETPGLSTIQPLGILVPSRGQKRKLNEGKPQTTTKRLRKQTGENQHWDTDEPSDIVENGGVTVTPAPSCLDRQSDLQLLRGSNEGLDPTFDISNDTESGEDSDSSRQVGKLEGKVFGPKPRRYPPGILTKPQYAEYLATKRFLYELDQEEIEKNYSYVCKSEGCHRRFRDCRQLRSHKRNEHSEALFLCSFQCPFCPAVWFPFDYQLDAHIIRVHQEEEKCYICPILHCPSKYKNNLKLVRHLQTQHPNYSIEESWLTPFSFGLEHRDQAVMGLVPGNATWRKKRDTTHRMVRCPVPGCVTRCASQLILDMHHAKVHNKEPLPCKCREPGCTKAFKNYEGYWDHMKLQHGAIGKKENVFTCLFCPYRALGRGNWNAHMRRKHGREDVLKFPCKYCGHLYFVNSDCEEHEKLHTEEAEWSCVIERCEVQGLTSQEALRVHIQTAHDEKIRSTVICDICGSVQVNNWRLKLHTRIHTGEEPYKCRYCEHRFKTPMNRTSHEEIMHRDKMEKKTYNCKLCDETFTVRQYLYKHNAWHKHGANANLPIAKKKPII